MESATDYLARLQKQAPNAQHWDWEATLARSYSQLLQPGAVVIDVGAHTGRHVDCFRHPVRCARIYAVEPQPEQASYLQTRYRDAVDVQVVTRALGAEAGTARFTVNSAAPEESGLRRRHYNDESSARIREIDVDVGTVDQLVADEQLSALHFIKVDVEGAEIDVLQGGNAAIQRFRPLLAVEYGSPSFSVYGRQPGDLFELAASMDYCIMDLLGHRCVDRADWLSLVDAYYWDFLLVPSEKAEQVSRRLDSHAWPVPAAAQHRHATGEGTRWWQRLRHALRPGRGRADIEAAYREVLSRAPDAAGLEHYHARLLAGQLDIRGIKAELRASDEYAARQQHSAH
ncbi:FkbM family methyltransferase [Chromatocurvus halotolerans]|uniref:FkbM family methyltransferase n=1 Tax=Chromatocurvus halotolerans TaxID=1132028 RepID=A0A4R2KM87_9GAMM|nr:FkbM family methyltransferase [Chromatocurvus halotolerans]TCO73752.1 FkbM family methyltransferase [Chromatocurvus halotolerans]